MSHTEQMREALRKVRPYLEDGANHGDDAVELLKLVDEALTAPAAEVPEAMTDTDVARIFRRVYGGNRFDATERMFAAEIAAARDAQWQSTRLRGGVPEPRIEIDFKQATELLAMFGGEPSLVTLMPGDGHSGKGLYAYWTDLPGEGAIYLGATDDDAAPQAPDAALDADGEAFRTAARLGLTLRFHGGCAQSGMPGSPSAYEVVTGADPAASMRQAVRQAAAVIEAGGEPQRLNTAPALDAGVVRDAWIAASDRVPLEADGEVFVRFTDGSIGTAWATYWHGASNDFAQWTHPDPDEDRVVSHWMKAPPVAAMSAQAGWGK